MVTDNGSKEHGSLREILWLIEKISNLNTCLSYKINKLINCSFLYQVKDLLPMKITDDNLWMILIDLRL